MHFFTIKILFEKHFLTKFLKDYIICWFLKEEIKEFSLGTTEVRSSAIVEATPCFTEALTYTKMQLP